MMPDAGLSSQAERAEPEVGSAATACDRGFAAWHAGDRDAATAWFRRALELEPAHARSRLALANTLREQGHIEEAEMLYRALLAADPGNGPARAGLGLCARLRGDLAGAAGHLAAALAATPNERWVRLDHANILRELGQPGEAEPVYRALLADAPDFWQARAGLGLSLRPRGDLAGAAEHLAAALHAAPDVAWLRLEYADTLRAQGRIDQAEAAYRALLADDSGIWQALAGLAACARQRGDWAGMAAHLAAALALTPGDRWMRLDYANALREQGRADEAEPVYRALLLDVPGFWPALAGLGLSRRARGDLAGAAAQLAAALDAAPDVAWPRLEYAATLREQRRLDDAEAVYRALLADDPSAWRAMLGLGLCARLRDDRDGAVAHFTAATTAAPDEEEAWYELAGAYREQGRFDAARAVLRPLFDRGLAGPRAWFALGHVERWAGDRAAALDAFRQGYAHHPDWPRFMIEIALEEQALDRPAEAERWFLRAAEVDAVAGAALLHLGNLARGRQQMQEAAELFRQAAARPGAPVEAHVSLAQMLADLGRRDEALAVLADAEARIGGRPELACARANLLRRAGFRHEALAVARQAVAAMPAHSPLWFEWFENERLSGDFAGIERCLAAAPAATIHDRALTCFARGQTAEQLWRLDAAAALFGEAVALHPGLSAAHEILARLGLLRFDIPAAREQLAIMRDLRAAEQRRQGLSPHLAHTHIGNLFDEFVIDGAALAALVQARALAPEPRIGRLLALLRTAPDHTPTAIALLIALREAGRFATPGGAADGPRIPPTIAQFWDEATPPEDVAALLRSWPERNPAHRYERFHHASAVAFLKTRCAPEVLRAYVRAREPAQKADLFRLAWLFAEGGCYADADDRCLRPLAELLPPGAGFVACQEHFGTLGNNFLAAAPLHPMLGLALHLATQALDRGDDDMIWLSTGPGLLTRAFARTLAMSELLPATWLGHAAILARHDLERVVATHCDLGYKHSRRHWLRASFGQPRPPAGAAPAKA